MREKQCQGLGGDAVPSYCFPLMSVPQSLTGSDLFSVGRTRTKVENLVSFNSLLLFEGLRYSCNAILETEKKRLEMGSGVT